MMAVAPDVVLEKLIRCVETSSGQVDPRTVSVLRVEAEVRLIAGPRTLDQTAIGELHPEWLS